MLYLFDDYTLDTQLYELRHAGVPCPLEPQVFAILRHLIEHRDRVVTRRELLEHVWSEVLGQLGRSPTGGDLVALLRQYAPSWLPHLPTLVPVTELEALQRQASGATQERMLREVAEVVEALTTVRPLVLVLEDLHWSDAATLDWLVYVARRRQAARLLVLGTYRPAEAAVHAHPVHRVAPDLQVHGQCAELALEYLSEAAVATYLTQRFADARLPEGLARVLHQRTNGNPLFLVTMVDALVRQGVLRAEATGWSLVGELATVAASIPENLRQLLERHVEQLAAEEQEFVEAASVAGAEFAAAAVAAAVEWPVEDVEERCAALARRGQFVHGCGTDAWPDGTVASRYGFRHALYRETLYERVPAEHCARRPAGAPCASLAVRHGSGDILSFPGIACVVASWLPGPGPDHEPHRPGTGPRAVAPVYPGVGLELCGDTPSVPS